MLLQALVDGNIILSLNCTGCHSYLESELHWLLLTQIERPKMSFQRLAYFLSCLLGMAPLLNAAVSERDFLAPGDGLLTYDDINQQEWLDLTATLDWSLAELYEAIAPHGPLRGFSIATVEDLVGLANSANLEWIPPGQFFSTVDSESAPDRATE